MASRAATERPAAREADSGVTAEQEGSRRRERWCIYALDGAIGGASGASESRARESSYGTHSNIRDVGFVAASRYGAGAIGLLVCAGGGELGGDDDGGRELAIE